MSMMLNFKTIIDVVGTFTAACGLLVAARTLLLNLERSRRELAVKLIYDWANDVDWATSRAVKIATQLPAPVVSSIGRREPTSMSTEFYNGMLSILRTEFPEKDFSDKPTDTKVEFEITAEQSAFIRFLWIRWLNRLEGTLAAWARGAADLTLMHAEFEPLVEGSEAALDALSEIRKGLPIIDEFYRQIKESGRIVVIQPLGFFSWN